MPGAPRSPHDPRPGPATGDSYGPTVTSPRVAGLRRLYLLWNGGSREETLREGKMTIGRTADCDVALDHPSVSRLHAALHVGAECHVEDLGSSNGTWVAGRRLPPNERALVEAGVAVEVGDVLLVVRDSAAPAGATPEREVGLGHGPTVAPTETPMARLARLVELVADNTISVLLQGETGVGKEVFAEEIHRRSPRRAAPMVRLNCAALTETLVESELFGFERGAFTGAAQAKAGLLETADGGTIFLDEVGELPPATQAKLLRVLETREVQRLGSTRPRTIDVRFVSASNRDLRSMAAAGTFRSDLYYRLNGITLTIPPLRARRDEIPRLATSFVRIASERAGRPVPPISADAMRALELHDWPGNIRELKAELERAVLLSSGASTIERVHLEAAALGGGSAPAAPSATSAGALPDAVARMERDRIVEALDRCGGNQTKAAAELGISRHALIGRLEAYGFPRPRKDKRKR